ncbi:hypothetical protein SAMN02745166_00634 [Prosthecobacter debontii]|uniref:Uncharacterized protein n=1 Tax=Prosthecobacter debontii TaxID=48467 RepID=A0A1T4WUB5_9BACT|nr:hypothetical protein [Prosthecobacter debontii]SKA80448.1 hypothetical protein SAMN02745166_00634 [Prosthecobacter debontii]
MKLEHLERAFEAIGARFQVEVHPGALRWDGTKISSGYSLNIGHDRHGQYFTVSGDEESLATAEFLLLNQKKHDRHLLLLAKSEGGKRKDRFLCGHDEREWFIAAVPGSASTVMQAKEALKPATVRQAQARKGLNARQANTRHNVAFRRQGEWFFVPLDKPLAVDPKLILRHEPISRSGGGKPHLVEQLYRTGGEVVYVHQNYPRGLTPKQYEEVLLRRPTAKRWSWRQMHRNPGVYARGSVRHPDHETIVLHDWCRVLMNEEHLSPSRSNLAFLD